MAAVAPGEAAPPKLAIEKFADASITCLKFTGTIDEAFEGKKVGRTLECETLVLDLGGVKKISSFGIREWVDFISTAVSRTKQLVMIECTPKVVDQLNMVANFTGGGRVFSFYTPFRCDYCDSEHRVLLEMAKDFETMKAMKLAERPCPACKESMYFDEDGSTFFSYVLGQGAFELDPEVVTFLSAKLDYRVGTIDAKLRIDKIIDGRITYLRLTGDLNNAFPRDKLVEGLEGTVILDVTGVTRVEPAGAAEWRSFIQQVTPLVDQIYLLGVAPAVLERLCGKDDLGAKTQVVSLTLPYSCKTCGTTSAHTIDVAEHHSVLKFATAPELRCPECKTAMQGVAAESLMTILPGLPRPATTKELDRKIVELHERKIEKKTSTGIMSIPKVIPDPPTSKVAPILVALVLVVGAGAGVLGYQRMTRKMPGPYGIGPVTASSGAERPAWILPELAPGSERCAIEADHGISCVGVSSPLASQEEAEDEASDTAMDALGNELGRRAVDKAWLAAVPVLYTTARDATYAAYGRDPHSTQARRDMHEARHAVSLAFHGAAPPITARYWDALDTGDGRKFVAFARLSLPLADLQRLTARYTKPATALGATVVDYFPMLGWRFARVDHGAIVMQLDHGVLQDLGVAEHYVVLSIDGRDVLDAASFARLATEELAQLADHGGAFRLMVQTETGDPREFSTKIPGKHVETVPTSGPRDGHTGHDLGPGGVNVWDRFGGNRGGGRDDPAQ